MRRCRALLDLGCDELSLGDTIGVANPAQVERVLGFVQRAVAGGAQVLWGGGPHPFGAQYLQPTMLTNLQQDDEIVQEEVFGPVITVQRFSTEAEAAPSNQDPSTSNSSVMGAKTADAAAALDWVQSIHPEASTTWIAGYSFGALIGMQLLMRRPEIRGFISIAPPANMYDFSFLAPCPASGIMVQGVADTVVTPISVQKLVDKLRTQKHITIHHDEIPRANHFFENEMDDMMRSVDNYLDFRLSPDCPIR